MPRTASECPLSVIVSNWLLLCVCVCVRHTKQPDSLSKSSDCERVFTKHRLCVLFCCVFICVFDTKQMKKNPSHDKQERGDGNQTPTYVFISIFFFSSEFNSQHMIMNDSASERAL